jgi:CubicO group peptidase (beta-lactamase class C family)
MQLVEQGRADLDVDVNTYLGDVRIPKTFEDPVTLHQLLTHTAGFELRVNGYARRHEELGLLGQWIRNNMRERIRPPGQFAAYTNIAPTLVGHIIENVSGMAYEAYMSKHILAPLRMRHSTLEQPVPERLQDQMAVGYEYVDNMYRALPFEYVHVSPSGALSATAADIGKFMLAHLQKGRYEGARLIQETTANEMHRVRFTHDGRLSGLAYGFYQWNRNGLRLLVHRGYMAGFSSIMGLLPDENLGFFIVFSCDGYYPRLDFPPLFLDHYYPMAPFRADLPGTLSRPASQLTGRYLPTSAQSSNFQKVLSPMYAAEVSATEDGGLVTEWARSRPKQWVETEPLVFREIDGHDTMIFHEDDQGEISHLLFNSEAPIAFMKLPWHYSPTLHLPLVSASMLLLLSAVICWPIGVIRGRGHGGGWIGGSAKAIVWCIGLFSILFVVGLALSLQDFSELIYGISSQLRSVLMLPQVIVALTCGAVLLTVAVWRRACWTRFARLHFTALVVAAAVECWQFVYWNLV